MTLRLILFIIAIVIIAWIIWDHNKKQVKTNKYVENQPLENFFSKYLNLLLSRKPKNKNTYNFFKNTKSDEQFQSESYRNNQLEKSNKTKSLELNRSNALSYDEAQYNQHDDDEYQEEFENEVSEVNGRDVLCKGPTQRNEYDSDTPFVVSVYIRAKDQHVFGGDQLLQGLVSVGCRYGEMNIFHRHEKTSGQGEIMFSIASMVNPGTFHIDNMHDFKTPGLILFFTAPGTLYEPTIIYDLMLKTAYKLAKFLDAEILDSNRELLSPDTINQVKVKLGQYEMIG